MKNNIALLTQNISLQLNAICADQSAATQEAWWLLEKLLQKSKTELLLQKTFDLSEQQEQQLTLWLKERINQKKPLQYILGSVPFCGLEILTEPQILIPRPETEEWVFWLINKLKPVHSRRFSVLDIGTGSGCITLALAKAFPQATVIGCDINIQAIELARKNQALNNISNVTFVQSDLFASLPFANKFDLVVSNPPYGSHNEWTTLSDEVKNWEDPAAFIAGTTGNEFYEKILAQISTWLKTDSILKKHSLPQIVFELGVGNINIDQIFKQYGYPKTVAHTDLQGKTRWIECQI